MAERKGRITLNEEGERIGSSIEHLRPGDTLIVEDRYGNELYRTKFDPKKL